jgi:hypothetical protein
MVDTLHVKWRIWGSDISSETESGKDLKNLSLYRVSQNSRIKLKLYIP